jgi:hypothetical protein
LAESDRQKEEQLKDLSKRLEENSVSSLSSQHRSRSPDPSTQEKRLLSGEEASVALRSELSVATSALVSDRLFASFD